MSVREPPLELDSHRLGVFTKREAVAAGWTVKALVRAVESGRLVRIRRGVFAAPVDDRDISRARVSVSAALVTPGATVSHLGSATTQGLPTWAAEPRPCLTVSGRALTAVPPLHLHSLRGGGLTPPFFTGPARTVVDIAREFGIEAAVVTGDAALARGLLSRSVLIDAIGQATGTRGISAARQVPDLLGSASESPLESRSRWQFVARDLPKPWTQTEIMSTVGEWIGRVDFFWPCGVVGEVDGSMKYSDASVLRREKWRQERLERLGLIVIRWGARDLLAFGPTARRLEYAISRQQTAPSPRTWCAVPPH